MKKLTLNCNCVGGAKYCGKLEVIRYPGKDGDIELGVSEQGKFLIKGKKETERWQWVYLNKKSVEKLAKFLFLNSFDSRVKRIKI